MLDILKTALISITTFITTLFPQPTYVEGVVGQPVEFNPLVKSQNEIDETIESLIFANLIDDLAENIEISQDGKEYIFHIKQGLTFHNGQEITAEDVAYSLRQINELKSLTLNIIDSTTFRIVLEEPFAPLLELLKVGVVPKDTDFETSPLNPIGSGDFKITDIKKGDLVEEITLAATRGNFKVDKITFRFFPTYEELAAAVKLGDVMAYAGPTLPDWPNIRHYQSPLKSRYYGLFFNLNGLEILKDRDFRRNLARALDKETIVKQACDCPASIIDGPLANSWAESKDISIYQYDPDLDISYNVAIKLTVPATISHLKEADIIKEMWSKLGVAVEINPVAVKEIMEKVIKPKNFDVLLYGQEVGRDPDRYIYWHSAQQDLPGLNFTAYEQMRVDKALEEGRREMDPEKRKEHYANFQRILTADVPAIYLYQPIYTFGVSKKITGINIDNLFYPQDRFLNLKDWKFE